MSAKPILFKTDMIRAILDGRKTMTRRAIKPQPASHLGCKLGFCVAGDKKDIGKFGFGEHECGGRIHFVRPPCLTGDILYIRETWRKSPFTSHYIYRADGDEGIFAQSYDSEIMDDTVCRWRPSIHMSKEAARIWLKVVDVRVERLRDIPPDEAIKEGTKEQFPPLAVDEFHKIWNATIKKPNLDRYGWDANPWVWVIEFERYEKPEEE